MSTAPAPTSGGARSRTRRALPRVLMVDDEIAILEGFELNLSRMVDITCATSGAAALEIMAERPPFAVITSDMRMPGMDGATFLAQARAISPDSVRILLTGNADVESAIASVNDGSIFRFLTKPCPQPTLVMALEAALEQHRLLVTERVLLRETLSGCLRVLTHALALIDPEAFGRSDRLRRRMVGLCRAMDRDSWQGELAAMLCGVGRGYLAPDVAATHLADGPLTDDARVQVDRLPALAGELLADVPRLDGVREVLGAVGSPDPSAPWEARALHALCEVERLERTGLDRHTALTMLGGADSGYDADVVAALRAIPDPVDDPACGDTGTAAPLGDIRAGSRTAADVTDASGRVLVAAGGILTPILLDQLRSLARCGALDDHVRIAMPSG